ncbi:probable E3 ubiquitin-protein ligase LOG2 [Zingiber officinale]|uniref:RING-type E3 ubiquitin transferase n=1 Tax=Zingiber officinale TaxID=94328 RepID=A0A8J5HNK7_ZINOF|nr:probable E3 ubiquitin-protein ligase LOG2 [Zingiber officinale]KAG6529589.1 hypothetical protein ZIOFF_011798 [Zingiber officinale]
MGNAASNGTRNGGGRSNSGHHQSNPFGPLPSPPQPTEASDNLHAFAATTPYPPQYPNLNPPQYYPSGYHPPPPLATPVPSYQYHRVIGGPHGEYSVRQSGWMGRGRYPPDGPLAVPSSNFEHQNTVAIRNFVDIKKETLGVEPDEENPGRFLVSFFFDATVAGSITIIFFAKEGAECSLTATKDLLQPVTVSFKEGSGQKFRQSSGTGINFSMFDEAELMKEGEEGIYPLAIKAEACPSNYQGPVGEDQKLEIPQSQITQALFKRKGNGDYHILVVKQILRVNQTKYELQDIYGIGNSVDNAVDGNEPGKECVICLSEPRQITVLPCRHMCMCHECAKIVQFHTNRCPICRQPVGRLLEIQIDNGAEQQHQSQDIS